MRSLWKTLVAALASLALVVVGFFLAAVPAAAAAPTESSTASEAAGSVAWTSLSATGGSPAGLIIFFGLTALALGALAVIVCRRRPAVHA